MQLFQRQPLAPTLTYKSGGPSAAGTALSALPPTGGVDRLGPRGPPDGGGGGGDGEPPGGHPAPGVAQRRRLMGAEPPRGHHEGRGDLHVPGQHEGRPQALLQPLRRR